MESITRHSDEMTRAASRYLQALRVASIIVWVLQTSAVIVRWIQLGAPAPDVAAVFVLSCVAFVACRLVLLEPIVVQWTSAPGSYDSVAYDRDVWRRLDLVRDVGVGLMAVGFVFPASYALGFGLFLFGVVVWTRDALRRAER